MGTLIVPAPAPTEAPEMRAGFRVATWNMDHRAVIDAPSTPDAVPFAKDLALLANVRDDDPYFVYGEYEDRELLRITIELDPVELG